jgi:hypothetical protein
LSNKLTPNVGAGTEQVAANPTAELLGDKLTWALTTHRKIQQQQESII